MSVDHDEEIFNCPICLEDMTSNQPRALSCLHTFCEKCLNKIRRGPSKSVIRCPNCRKDTQVPKEGIHKLPENFLLKTFKEFVKNISNNNDKTLCQICNLEKKYVSAESFCESCKCLLCTSCSSNHIKHPLFKTHRQKSITEYQKEIICEEHGLYLSHYCAKCDRYLCISCVISQIHNEHLNQLKETDNYHERGTKRTDIFRETLNVRHKTRLSLFSLKTYEISVKNRLKNMRTFLADFRSNADRKDTTKKLQKLISTTTDKYLHLQREFDSDMRGLNISHASNQDLLFGQLQEIFDGYSIINDRLRRGRQKVYNLLALKAGVTDLEDSETEQKRMDKKLEEFLEGISPQHDKIISEIQTRLIKFEQDCETVSSGFQCRSMNLIAEMNRKVKQKFKVPEQEMTEETPQTTVNASNWFIVSLIIYCTVFILFTIFMIYLIHGYLQRRSMSVSQFVSGFIDFLPQFGVSLFALALVLGISLLIFTCFGDMFEGFSYILKDYF